MTKTTVIHVNDMQPGDVYIGRAAPRRGLTRSKWANPVKVGRGVSRETAISTYREYVVGTGLIQDIHELKGKRLACWCKPKYACHGDVLAELADAS